MDKKSKSISGLRAGKIIIQEPNNYFTDSEKHQIIQELLDSGCTKVEIFQLWQRKLKLKNKVLKTLKYFK